MHNLSTQYKLPWCCYQYTYNVLFFTPLTLLLWLQDGICLANHSTLAITKGAIWKHMTPGPTCSDDGKLAGWIKVESHETYSLVGKLLQKNTIKLDTTNIFTFDWTFQKVKKQMKMKIFKEETKTRFSKPSRLVVLLHVEGTSERIARVMRKHQVPVAVRPVKTENTWCIQRINKRRKLQIACT